MTTLVQRALISVSDKRGIVKFAQGLVKLGIEIISTGGTADFLAAANIPVTRVKKVTGFPEIFDGRVKTLHPKIHGGILRRRNDLADQAEAIKHRIKDIDLVVVNLYPFMQVILRPDCSFEEAVENIDIGGPAMIRSAAKNHKSVIVVVDPRDFSKILRALRNDEITPHLRLWLAVKAFKLTAAYDRAIYDYLRYQ